jgi:hypothetical protein
MARDYRFRKRSILDKIVGGVRNFLALLGVMVLLYFARTGNPFAAIQIYMFEYPISEISDVVTTILNYTIYGT